MGGSFMYPPAKRSIHMATGMLDSNQHIAITSGATTSSSSSSKRFKSPPPPLIVPAGHVAFRILCHSSRVGGVIGKSGSVIKQLQQETSSKIRVEVPPPGSEDYSVVLVVASTSLSRRITVSAAGRLEDEEIEVSAAQEAVIRVYQRIIEVASESDGLSVTEESLAAVRLLAEVSQAGAVIGKGGKVVEKIRKDTSCKIKVLRSETLPACASLDDEIIEIEGDIMSVKKALVAVTRCIQDCQPTEKLRNSGSKTFQAVTVGNLSDFCNVRMDPPPQPSSNLQLTSTNSVNYASSGQSLSLDADRVYSPDSRIPQQEVVFRILCSNDRVGGVIGKGGIIIKALQSETGASITIGNSIAECNERLITVTAKENPDSRYSPAQKAAILVFNRSVEAGIEKGLDSGAKGLQVSAQLVVSPSQAGCLLGKGGAIISEMRKVTGAGIWIIRGDQVPKCISENDEVIKITGEFVNVQDALYNITGKLRDNIMPSKMSTSSGTRSTSSVITELSPYARVRDSPLGLSSFGGISHSLNRHTILNQRLDHFGLSHDLDLPASPRLFTSQTLPGLNPRNIVDVGRGLTCAKGGLELGSGKRSAIVTNTTVEIVVPESVIGSVYGENGSNLARLRQISGAKVTVHEPLPGTSDRIIIISGTPEETQAAQSLLHAFILTAP